MLGSAASTVEDFGDFLGHVWPVFVLVGSLYAFAARITKRVVHQVTENVDEKLDARIAPVLAEVTVNGGGSMKDAQRRMEKNLLEVKETLLHTSAISTANAARIEAVTSTLPAAYYEVDEHVNVTSVNEAYLWLFDINENQAINSLIWRSKVVPEDLEMVDRSGASSLAAQRDWYCSFSVKRGNKIIPVVARAKPMFVNGQFSGYSGVMTFDPTMIDLEVNNAR